ncbi:MAG: AAA family ATPase [Gammaproteobacteria bacterium]
MDTISSIEDTERLIKSAGYVTEEEITTAIYLAMQLQRPLLVEGFAGVGKTEVAKVLATVLDTELIRLQCYEGLDTATALYEWNYAKQILRVRLEEGKLADPKVLETQIFDEDYLLERPLLKALRCEKSPVLLIDEIDRADEEFEAFLLEILAEYQVSIPELGTIRATEPPIVVLTSNRVRELGEALRRRCLYLWIDYPSFEKELAIVKQHLPTIDRDLAAQICRFVANLRELEMDKRPGVAETLDWAEALVALHLDHVDEATIRKTITCLAKTRRDTTLLLPQLTQLSKNDPG